MLSSQLSQLAPQYGHSLYDTCISKKLTHYDTNDNAFHVTIYLFNFL